MYNIEEFILVMPTQRNTKPLAFSVMMDDTVRVNGRLCAEISSKNLCIRIHPNKGHISLQQSDIKDRTTCSMPKSGVIKIPDLHGYVKKCKIGIPARYIAHWEDSLGMWIGEHDPHYVFPKQSNKAKIRKPRKKDLHDMLPEKGV